MKRVNAIGVVVAILTLLGGFLLYGYINDPASAGSDFSAWSPSPAAIRSKIGSVQSPTPGMSDRDRRDRFCKMFKSRFRDHDPAVAIGIRFLTPTKIKLMAPARMEPFVIDQVAMAAWHEARASFGTPMDIDIYDTFIGTHHIKIGELRSVPAKSDVAHISYDFTAVDRLNSPHAVPSGRGPHYRPLRIRNMPPGYFHRGEPVL